MTKTRGIAIAIPSRDPIPERTQIEQLTIVETLSPPERQDKHRKIKTNKRRIRAWEDDPDEQPVNVNVTTMAELCKDVRVGRKSKVFRELEKAKYEKFQERKAKKKRLTAAVRSTPVVDEPEGEEVSILDGIEDPDEVNNTRSRKSETSVASDIDVSDGAQEYVLQDDGSHTRQRTNSVTSEHSIEIVHSDEEASQAVDSGQESNDIRALEWDLGGIKETYVQLAEIIFELSLGTAAPQVRVVNGEIVIDEDSLRIDRSAMHKPVQEELLELVVENPYSTIINSASYSKRSRANEKWKEDETELFYKALSMWGTDFEIISKLFPTRTRRQVKAKFKRESRLDPKRINEATANRIPIDLEEFTKITGVTLNVQDISD
ncbi:8621_t:CDS:2 [Paraglomus occultum]|uniref:8621_t:CDS:1 n=1 Tax=Paraglomus occultum TaxID=144539 RepID=A0A9N9BFP7_9GLOM|nr:8621_t:CDS:2 [Paraglomus occultum]